MKCPHCEKLFTPSGPELAAELGSRSSLKKARAARKNGKLGGWPKGKKRSHTKNKTTKNKNHHYAKYIPVSSPE